MKYKCSVCGYTYDEEKEGNTEEAESSSVGKVLLALGVAGLVALGAALFRE